MRVACFAAAALLMGCASSSGVHAVAPGEFTLTTNASPSRGGIEQTRANALEEASATCRASGKQLKVQRESTTQPTWTDGMAHTTLDFVCVDG